MGKNNKVRGTLCILSCLISMGLYYLSMNLWGVFTIPLITKLGVPYQEIAIMWTTMSLGSVAIRFVLGPLFDKFSPKLICAFGSLNFLSLVVMGSAKSSTMVIVSFFFVGIFGSLCGAIPWQLLGTKWIGKGRGTLIGCAQIFTSIFTAIFAPMVTGLVETVGFEKTAIYSGIILCAVTMLLSVLFLSREPQYYKMEPLDINFLEKKSKKNSKNKDVIDIKMPMKNIMKTPTFWSMMIIPILLAFVLQAFYSNQSNVYYSFGLDLVQVSRLVSIYSIASAIIVWLFGFLSDKIGARIPMLCFAAIGCILWLGWPVVKNLGFAGALIIAVFANVGQISNYMGPFVMIPVFGVTHSNKIIGWANLGAAVGSVFAPVVVALMSGYNTLFVLLGIIYALTFIVVFLVTGKKNMSNIKDANDRWLESQK